MAKIIIFFPRPIFSRASRRGNFSSTPTCMENITARLRDPILSNLHKGVDVLIDIDTQGAAAIRAI